MGQHVWRVEIDVFGFVVGSGFYLRCSEVSPIGSQSSLHYIKRLSDVFFDNFAGDVDTVAAVFGSIDFGRVDAVVA